MKKATVSPLFERRDWPPEKIAVEAAAGSHWAKEVMYRQYAPFLINMLTRISGSSRGVDDVVQDTFLLAYEKIGTLKDLTALRTWLCRIAINELRKRERRGRFWRLFGVAGDGRDADLLSLAVSDAPPDVLAELRRIDALLLRVDREWRVAWLLRKVEGMTIVETARVMGRSQATVKRYVHAVDVALRIERTEQNHG